MVEYSAVTLLAFEEEEEHEEGSDVAAYGSVVWGLRSSDKRRTREAMKLDNGGVGGWFEGFVSNHV